MRRCLLTLFLGAWLWATLSCPAPMAATRGTVHRLPPMFLTGYDLRGRTATGAWAGPGVCATDPRVIPLGSRLRIPGLGSCTALDTGGAIVGDRIDVWEPTDAACYAITGWYRGVTWRR